jgi:hypothetical protein
MECLVEPFYPSSTAGINISRSPISKIQVYEENKIQAPVLRISNNCYHLNGLDHNGLELNLLQRVTSIPRGSFYGQESKVMTWQIETWNGALIISGYYITVVNSDIIILYYGQHLVGVLKTAKKAVDNSCEGAKEAVEKGYKKAKIDMESD